MKDSITGRLGRIADCSVSGVVPPIGKVALATRMAAAYGGRKRTILPPRRDRRPAMIAAAKAKRKEARVHWRAHPAQMLAALHRKEHETERAEVAAL